MSRSSYSTHKAPNTEHTDTKYIFSNVAALLLCSPNDWLHTLSNGFMPHSFAKMKFICRLSRWDSKMGEIKKDDDEHKAMNFGHISHKPFTKIILEFGIYYSMFDAIDFSNISTIGICYRHSEQLSTDRVIHGSSMAVRHFSIFQYKSKIRWLRIDLFFILCCSFFVRSLYLIVPFFIDLFVCQGDRREI